MWIVDFAVPVNHRVRLKESEKKDKYLDLAKGLKKLWNIKQNLMQIDQHKKGWLVGWLVGW